MKGVLLVNMGGAASQSELKTFLARMFKDPFILPFGKLGRNLLSFIISNTRYKKSWKKYQLIGGTPIIKATINTVNALQQVLDKEYSVKMAFSYSAPFINESIESFVNEGINEIIVIPLYPQSSISTTSSVEKDVRDVVSKQNNIKINFVKEFHDRESFVNFWTGLISNHLKTNGLKDPYLVFSAHSIPENLVEKGDTYSSAVRSSSKAIAEKLGLSYEVAFQSGMKTGKWVGPDLKDRLRLLSEDKKDEIVIIPIAFVNENLETLYDLDHDIIPLSKNVFEIKNITRVKIPVADKEFIRLLVEIVEEFSSFANKTN